MNRPSKHTLLTNLSYCAFTDKNVRCTVAAILITEDYDPLFGPKEGHVSVRGFGPDPAWPVFDMRLPLTAVPFRTDGAESALYVMKNGQARPSSQGMFVRFTEGTQLELLCGTREDGVDIEEFPVGAHIATVWKALTDKTARYVDTPNRPYLQWAPNPNRRSD